MHRAFLAYEMWRRRVEQSAHAVAPLQTMTNRATGMPAARSNGTYPGETERGFGN
jgi:hypothetical protein